LIDPVSDLVSTKRHVAREVGLGDNIIWNSKFKIGGDGRFVEIGGDGGIVDIAVNSSLFGVVGFSSAT
jgi:hypothetical protein